MNVQTERPSPVTGLVLSGGGARAAYQVGVLGAIEQIRRDCAAPRPSPFPVLAGTSAGAINAAALACRADDFSGAVGMLTQVWAGFSAEQVYQADSLGIARTGARWLGMLSLGWTIARWRRTSPRSLLDNAPLEALLRRTLRLERLNDMMRQGYLDALAITTSSYGSGQHVTFYDAVRDLLPWTRSQRIAVRDTIGIEHLMASAAIPFVFPAAPLVRDGRTEYFGDGSMRQVAPISPAIHLGAQRILIVGASHSAEPAAEDPGGVEYPSLAQIAGHALSSIFLDALAVDVERLQRINNTLALLDAQARAGTQLRPLEVLVVTPSQRLDALAARHLGALPRPVRSMLGAVGVSSRGAEVRGAALASYLLFEAAYTRELIALGRADTLARRDEVARFLGWERRTRLRDHGAPKPPVETALE